MTRNDIHFAPRVIRALEVEVAAAAGDRDAGAARAGRGRAPAGMAEGGVPTAMLNSAFSGKHSANL